MPEVTVASLQEGYPNLIKQIRESAVAEVQKKLDDVTEQLGKAEEKVKTFEAAEAKKLLEEKIRGVITKVCESNKVTPTEMNVRVLTTYLKDVEESKWEAETENVVKEWPKPSGKKEMHLGKRVDATKAGSEGSDKDEDVEEGKKPEGYIPDESSDAVVAAIVG